MLLLKATEDLRIGGRPYADFPILLWDDMTGCEPVNRFFRHHLLRGRVESKHTWDAAGQALYDYFSFLQANELTWDGVAAAGDKDAVAAYRDYSREDEGHKRATLRLRLNFIVAFYEHCLAQGLVSDLPFSYEAKQTTARAGSFLGHAIPTAEAVGADVMPKADRDLPRFLSREQVRQTLRATRNPHHRMMIQFAFQTGLRRAEIATFPLSAVFDPRGLKTRNVQVTLDPSAGDGQKTKGRQLRTVWLPVPLMQDLHYYVKHHRNERAGLTDTPQKPLFLNSRGRPFAEDGKALSRIFAEIGQKAEVPLHPHLLRHTYATHTLVALQRNPQLGIDPLVFLQRQLGHASINTTMVNGVVEVDLFMEINSELDDMKEDAVANWLTGDTPLSGGYGRNLAVWRGTKPVTLFHDHAHMVRSVASSTALRSNGQAFCTADDTMCVGNHVERTRCGDCDNAVIDERHAEIYQGLYDHLGEVLNCKDIGEGGKARVQRDLDRCRSVLNDLGFDPLAAHVKQAA